MSQEETGNIKVFLAEAIARGSKDVVRDASERFGVSRQTIHKHLAEMVSTRILDAAGQTRGRTYRLRMLAHYEQGFPIAEKPAEDRVWREHFAPLLSELPNNVIAICNHGFTEVFNNAMEHSSGTEIIASLERTYVGCRLCVSDNGIGIFKKIKDGLHLADEREAILELAKGKATTEPQTHSGEGIFFTTRMFDSFSLLANGLFFSHKAPGAGEQEDDWFIESRSVPRPGTAVEMEIATTAARTTKEVFDRYSSNLEVPTFDKTHVPVRLLLVGEENLVSRSQAKRMLSRFARFKEVMLDFDGVSHIGQAFADEIFRVFKKQNPSIRILPLRANEDVQRMINRVLAGDQPPE